MVSRDGGTTVFDQTTYYYPYGLPMAESTSPQTNPYKYTAKELLTDQSINLADHGARFYDPAIARWLSRDPLSSTYPSDSHYLFCAGDPINYIDPNGKRGIRIINEATKTITIKANYYVVTADHPYREFGEIYTLPGYSTSDITEMNSYNDYLNNLKLTVPSGEFEGYSVQFDLTFEDGGNPGSAETMADKANIDGHIIGNTIDRANYKSNKRLQFEVTENKDGTITQGGGVTFENKKIIMNVSQDDKMNRIHEIFHTFGFWHPPVVGGRHGIMAYPPEKPSSKDALELSINPYLISIFLGL